MTFQDEIMLAVDSAHDKLKAAIKGAPLNDEQRHLVIMALADAYIAGVTNTIEAGQRALRGVAP